MTISVRAARPSDAEGIAQLTLQLGYDVDGAEVAARLARMLARPDHRFLVAELDGRLVGCVHAIVWEFVETGACVVLSGLVVDRSLRGKGVGRTLLGKVEEGAMEQGCSVVRRWSSVGRSEAHRFYEQLGYSNVKSQHVFVKSLDPAHPGDFGRFVPRLDR